MKENSRAEAERLLGIAEKLLHSHDLAGTKDFAILAQETEPLLEGSDQILAVADVLLSAQKRINNRHDWYSILQIDRWSDDNDLIKKQYRRLALLLHPDKNKFPLADQAFGLVADAWAVLSDSAKKSLYDNELNLFSKIDLSNSGKLSVWKSRQPSGKNRGDEDQSQRAKLSSFWTTCPYCYILYEYPRVYENCCLSCPNCQRAFHAALLPSMPPLVPGKEAYYCCWALYPLGYVFGGAENGGKNAWAGEEAAAGSPNWRTPVFSTGQQVQMSDKSRGPVASAPPPAGVGTKSGIAVVDVSDGRPLASVPARKKRGRPRKYPLYS